jgi:hypothetical protein
MLEAGRNRDGVGTIPPVAPSARTRREGASHEIHETLDLALEIELTFCLFNVASRGWGDSSGAR